MDMVGERGRPRSFDTEAALDRALEVFWRNGFQGASLSELTAAMGLSKPSIYSAFGDKETLYLKSLERYAARRLEPHVTQLEKEPDGRRAIECYLRAMVGLVADPSQPSGGFATTGSADCGTAATPPAVDQALRKAQQGGETRLRERLARAQREGQLAADARVENLAVMFQSLLAGLGVMAKGGAKRAKLESAIDAAMAVWPEVKAKGNGKR